MVFAHRSTAVSRGTRPSSLYDSLRIQNTKYHLYWDVHLFTARLAETMYNVKMFSIIEVHFYLNTRFYR